MKVTLSLGEVIISIKVDWEVSLNPELVPFLIQSTRPDVSANIYWEWDEEKLPDTEYLGRDSLQKYFKRDKGYCALTIADSEVYQARSEYTHDFEHIDCFINKDCCRAENMNIGTLMRFLPMRSVLTHFGILFFHASQISYGGRGIVFTAPSGIGKTTQAKLWQKTRGAELLCNDRTLIRKRDGKWQTYGYPLDGSEPVRSTKVTPLGCIVLLQQAEENQVERLKGSKAVAGLMSQLVIDAWDIDARNRTIELLIELLGEIPVYRLSCTPQEDAVECLENKLLEEGMLVNEDN